MKGLLFAFCVCAVNFGAAQTFKESINKCMKSFDGTVDTIRLKDDDAGIEMQMRRLRSCVIGLKFPLFKATAIDGRPVALSELRGKVALINLWFIGCHPCVEEIPAFNKLVSEFDQRDFTILAFGLDDARDIQEFIKSHPMNFNVFAKSAELIENIFNMTYGYPTSILLSKQGDVVELRIGGAVDSEGLDRMKTEMKQLINAQIQKR